MTQYFPHEQLDVYGVALAFGMLTTAAGWIASPIGIMIIVICRVMRQKG